MSSPVSQGFRVDRLLVRTGAVLGIVIAAHWLGRLAPLYFVTVAIAAAVFAVSGFRNVPGLTGLARLGHAERLVGWIFLVTIGAIGYLHNQITWVPDGHFLRPTDIGIWKTEMLLILALAGPSAHLLFSRILSRLPPVDGKRLAVEFALYVNFSGIALVLWTGHAGISLQALGAAVLLILLAELTLYATA